MSDKLIKCCECGKVDFQSKGFRRWSSLALDENAPHLAPWFCKDCQSKAPDAARMPILGKLIHGAYFNVKKAKNGYDEQPPQERLIREYAKAQS